MTFRVHRIALAAAACLLASSAHSQAQRTAASLIDAPPIEGERLSAWLLRNAGPNADTRSLHWRVNSERHPQEQLRQAVLQNLTHSPTLSDWLRSLPLTGRLPLASSDARWLQSAPRQDPILDAHQSVVLTPRPTQVAVLDSQGQICLQPHIPGALALQYLQACAAQGETVSADRAWLAQPDGRVSQAGIAAWNLEPQDEPAPGAWIWAPPRQQAVPDSLSDNLARFLSTQLPAEFMPGHPGRSVQAPFTPAAERPRSLPLTSNDWGEAGYLQTPSARMAGAGNMRFQMSRVSPYTRGSFMLQPLDWFEAGFRYTDIANRLYGPVELSGDQSYKDKSIDLKFRLKPEDALWPEVAVGLRDGGGTGLFSSEYLVASKRWGNWDASLGLGWGNMGSRGNVSNPLISLFGSRFKTRLIYLDGTGGTANTSGWFRGSTALFGGVQWHSPAERWVLKAELDGNDYKHEPHANHQAVSSPFNFGLVYRYSPNIDFSVGVERGQQIMTGLTLHGALDQLHAPKLLDKPLPAIAAQPPASPDSQPLPTLAQAIELYTGWQVRQIDEQDNSTTLVAEVSGARYLQERVQRAITLLHNGSPASRQRFVLQLQALGLPLTQVQVDRAEWLAQQTQAMPPSQQLPAQTVLPATAVLPAARSQPEAFPSWQASPSSGLPGLNWELAPSYRQIVGGPNNFLLYHLGVQLKFEQGLTQHTWVAGNANLRLLDNYDNFTYDGPSNLPRVRTFQRQFATTSRATLPLLQLTHVEPLGNGHYVSAYGGMLEWMYGGVGGEWLYRPWRSPFAFGIDANHVRQRDFGQKLSFRDYSVNTGHATLYWDTGWNDVQVNLSAGRYLAGDMGATLDLRRSFRNGVSIGAWATKTNVSKEQFGEGSFDKGIYVSIPFEAMLPLSSYSSANLVWNPLTRDGGARLGRRYALFDLTQAAGPRALQWSAALPVKKQSADDNSYILTEPRAGLSSGWGSSSRQLGQQIADIPGQTWLWAGGAVLASSLLDGRADRWAQQHPGGRWDQAGSAANALPLLMALGAGALSTGIAGEPAAHTADTALRAAAYSLGANLLLRGTVGRSRPLDGQGRADFNGFSGKAFQSGFASNHTALAFALATPFAQQHDMPWLYGLAGATALGRVQKREHWVSDTVAGALLGYGMGSLLGQQQQAGRTQVQWHGKQISINRQF
jgi:membrane-associated phospholipid phosphatase